MLWANVARKIICNVLCKIEEKKFGEIGEKYLGKIGKKYLGVGGSAASRKIYLTPHKLRGKVFFLRLNLGRPEVKSGLALYQQNRTLSPLISTALPA